MRLRKQKYKKSVLHARTVTNTALFCEIKLLMNDIVHFVETINFDKFFLFISFLILNVMLGINISLIYESVLDRSEKNVNLYRTNLKINL